MYLQFSVPSPPKSVEDKHTGLTSLGTNSTTATTASSLSKAPLNGPTAGELAIMFPTPPSLEPPHLSPGQLGDGQTDLSDRCLGQLDQPGRVVHKEEKLHISVSKC